jgi:hypothetical protein
MNMRALLLAFAAALSGCATTSSPQETWQALRASDPITGSERCTVTAPDRAFGRGYTRAGFIYPFVEMNSEVGLLVGVMSGGNYRVPPGDVQWRVDGNEHRTLRASRTPVIGERSGVMFNEGLMSSVRNGITAVDGDLAEEMLAEMLAGTGLLYRASATANMAGLATSRSASVGRMTSEGLEPYPLDASFRAALAECGISPSNP